MSKYLRNKVKDLEKEVKSRFVGNPEAVEAITLNLLHKRSTTLIRAPRGLGKSTLMMLFLRGIYGDDYVILSGASEIKRGEVVGRLHIPSLEKEGVERVIWAAFVKSHGKGIDEVNRLNPYTAANIYHLVQFGEVWAYGKKYTVGDYTLIGNENPHDPTTFVHPPPFYDRFDICVFLRSLTFSEKFMLEDLIDKFEGEIVESMPQVLSVEELEEIRKEVHEVELDVELKGMINLVVRDFQACIKNKEYSEIKPPTLCEGCHFIRDVCSRIVEGLSERAIVVLNNLAKAKKWLYGKVEVVDLIKMLRWTLPHRISLVRVKSIVDDIQELLNMELEKIRERERRRQWAILNELYKGFSRDLYFRAREIALEDIVFAEELMKLEDKWIKEKKMREDESLIFYLKYRSG